MRKLLSLGLNLLLFATVFGQNEDIILNSPLTEDITITTRGAIYLMPGFHAPAGINFEAIIDDSFLVELQSNGNDLTVSYEGGSGTISYLWSTGETTASISTNGTGIYSVKVTDGVGKQVTQSHRFTSGENSFYHNFVITQTLLVAEKDITAVESLNENQKSEVFQYFDGLGRPIQTVAVKASPAKNDIVRHIEYDEYGRQKREYLPYADTSQNGAYRKDAKTKQGNFHFLKTDIANSVYSYAEKVFDDSPLNRVKEIGAPGASWQPVSDDILGSGHTVKIQYKLNEDDDKVDKWVVDLATKVCTKDNFHTKNTLFKNITTDENKHLITEYTNESGNKILSKTSVTITNPVDGNPETKELCTYYIYDIFERLRFVLPPNAVDIINNGNITSIASTDYKELIYYYEYDKKGRMTKKKIAGADSITMIYDNLDRLVLTQDGNQSNNKEYTFIKYDKFSRAIITGIYASSATEEAIKTTLESYSNEYLYESKGTVDGTGHPTVDKDGNLIGTLSIHGYTNKAFPQLYSNSELLSVTYYDNYEIIDNYGSFSLPTGFDPISYYLNPKGLITGTLVWELETNDYFASLNYYDKYERLIQAISENHLNGMDRISNQYNFVGNVVQTKLEHSVDAEIDATLKTIWEFNEYDHAGRLKKVYHQYGDDSDDKVLLSAIDYNENSEIKSKKLHSTDNEENFLQTIDYKYNIRGWLTQINDADLSDANDLFGMELFYETGANPNLNFNGNISSMLWNTRGVYQGQKTYTYEYDEINRLTAADFNSSSYPDNSYNTSYIYDLNGNITSLSRYNNAGVLIDDLTYKYTTNSNKLKAVGDATENIAGFNDGNGGYTELEYDYDYNGNMKSDLNKGHLIQYNVLNLPSIIQDELTLDYLNNRYDAVGIKLASVIDKSDETGEIKSGKIHVGSFLYNYNLQDNSETYELAQIFTPEGRIVFGAIGEVNYEYFLKDHLGNNRVMFADNDGNSQAELIQEDSYYPFGMTMPMQSNVVGTNQNKYLYNDKELQDDILGNAKLEWYDYGARFYDPSLARWHVLDPLMEKYDFATPYNYCFNNPIKYIDPDGRDGMITGNGTKANPFIITATYFYQNGSLSIYEVSVLNDAVSAYNGLGGKYGIKTKDADGNTVYTKYDLSVEGVDDVVKAKLETSFITESGVNRYYGNEVASEKISGGEDFGHADNISIGVDMNAINEGVSKHGLSMSSLIKGTYIHEIGHNLGGEDDDYGNATMRQVSSTQTTNANTGKVRLIHSYPDVSKSFTGLIIRRMNTSKIKLGDGRLWSKKK